MPRDQPRPPPWLRAAAVALPLVFGETALAQQALERNAPPPAPARPAPVAVAAQDFGAADATPLGVDLAGVRLIGAGEGVAAEPPAGVSVGAVAGIAGADVAATVQPYLARPLSRRLIADIQGAVAEVWRQAGFPFVSVTAPPQEITSGVLHLRVVEFRMGAVSVEGDENGAAMAGNLRIGRGERIDAARLEEDLDWLNRVPYRRVEGIFSPGDETATSDLTLRVTRTRPWQVYAGWSNAGTAATGRNRFFLGGGAWIAPLGDVTLTYQVTGSDDLRPGRLRPESGKFARYLSHAGRIVLPTWPRQALEAAPGLVATREAAGASVSFENQTLELPVVYRSAVSNLVPGLHAGSVYAGAELKRLRRTTFFDGVAVAKGTAEVLQLVLGWAHAVHNRLGRTEFDLRLKANPGGVLSDNSGPAWAAFSGGRVADADYAYAALDLVRHTGLPHGFGWSSRFSGVLASGPLPDTERMALGGSYAVRGYGLDDGSIDSGFVWRNELAAPALPGLTPYLFADLGHGVDRFTGRAATLAAIGGGLGYALGGHATLDLAAGRALRDAAASEAGDWTGHLRIVARY